jgi:hypothetical protein
MKRKTNHPSRYRPQAELPWEEDLELFSWGEGDDLNQIAEELDHQNWGAWLADGEDDDPASSVCWHTWPKARSL